MTLTNQKLLKAIRIFLLLPNGHEIISKHEKYVAFFLQSKLRMLSYFQISSTRIDEIMDIIITDLVINVIKLQCIHNSLCSVDMTFWPKKSWVLIGIFWCYWPILEFLVNYFTFDVRKRNIIFGEWFVTSHTETLNCDIFRWDNDYHSLHLGDFFLELHFNWW